MNSIALFTFRIPEPTIFRYYFTKIALMGDKIRGQCNFCTSTICARKGITSNFVTHLKVTQFCKQASDLSFLIKYVMILLQRKHPKRHKEYATRMLTKRSRRIQSSDYYVDDSTNSPQNSIEEVTGKFELNYYRWKRWMRKMFLSRFSARIR